ncbi:hypothetical protein M431DRAFT_76416 [Trichoderma harzianum CBS 226.95]|uniref:Zn(2)-C6 fungal-type domain-containing protein n=1 Tax=Trichoderma harzianum CBS 226.95 TaxID=983964 RepID=A0A2T4AQE2_TRIHA|nr:hypothetical protein M431DRAFT_76416 [Trichoderma harzianum CBS 226.95]PTB59282.1 hypothetical protein M431DRAFT_76416 [Trichoderma harzianum CBS 226.95]
MGREPTSLGCHTCRQRRIRCDQAKPICARCKRAGYKCQGYEKVFRQQNYGVHQSEEGSTSAMFIKLNYATSYPCRLGQETRGGSESRHNKTVNEDCTSTSTLPEPADHPLRDEGFLEPFLDHVTFSYFFDSYGWINMHSMLLQDSPMRQHLAQEHDTLGYDSLRALTYGIFGRDHKIITLQRSASRIYGSLLRKLQHKLDTSTKSDLARLIKPIAIMGSYSIAVENDHRFTHHSGLAFILQHCGPCHFADASLLSIYESCRFTMVANALVRRQATFLERDEWKTTPWLLHPEMKTNASKLIDIVSDIPGIIQSTDDILDKRSQWVYNGLNIPRKETLTTVHDLQCRLEQVFSCLQNWQREWSTMNGPSVSQILQWALFRAKDDYYRPGIFGMQGPDAYGLNMDNQTGVNIPFVKVVDHGEPEPNTATFGLMTEAALFITALIWIDRLRKNLKGASESAESIDFYNSPFYTQCRCYYDSPGPLRLCQIFPDRDPYVERHLSWNLNSARICESPTFTSGDNESYRSHSSAATTTAAGAACSCFGQHSWAANTGNDSLQNILLPGDIRFSAQLRILNWLTSHLPQSRTSVLSTLAAMGLTHCVHDVRPSEGNEDIALAIRETMIKSRFQGAAELLRRKYR